MKKKIFPIVFIFAALVCGYFMISSKENGQLNEEVNAYSENDDICTCSSDADCWDAIENGTCTTYVLDSDIDIDEYWNLWPGTYNKESFTLDCNGNAITNHISGFEPNALLDFEDLSNVTIENCVFSDVEAYNTIYCDIDEEDPENIQIINNTFESGVNGRDIQLWGYESVLIQENVFNDMFNPTTNAIWVSNSTGEIIDNIINGYDVGIMLRDDADYEVLYNITNNAIVEPDTFYIFDDTDFIPKNRIAEVSYPVEYDTRSVELPRSVLIDKGIYMDHVHHQYGNIDSLSLEMCGESYIPTKAVLYEDRLRGVEGLEGRDVKELLISDDYDVVSLPDRKLYIEFDYDFECNQVPSLKMRANEHDTHFPGQYPKDDSSVSLDLNDIYEYILDVDGVLDSYFVGRKNREFSFNFNTGHPDTTNRLYISTDNNYSYFTLDLGEDNTDEYGYDWVEVELFDKGRSVGVYRVDDYDDTYGKCGFGRTDSYTHLHQMCELAIPVLPTVYDSYRIAYYGTGGLTVGGTGIASIANASTFSNNVSYQNETFGIAFDRGAEELISNKACFNSISDFYDYYPDHPTASSNTCDTVLNFWDDGTLGCSNPVPCSSLDVEIGADTTELSYGGGEVTFTYTVTNTTYGTISNLLLEDEDCEITDAYKQDDIDYLEEVEVECTREVTETTTETVSASAQDPNEEEVSDEDSITVTVSMLDLQFYINGQETEEEGGVITVREGDEFRVSGRTYPNAEVRVIIGSDDEYSCTTTSGDEGNFSCEFEDIPGEGIYPMSITAISEQGTETEELTLEVLGVLSETGGKIIVIYIIAVTTVIGLLFIFRKRLQTQKFNLLCLL